MADDPFDRVRKLWRPEDKDLLLSILDTIGDKWSQLVLGSLYKQPRRFTELVEVIPGVSRRMLTLRLRQLERDGLITRQARGGAHPSFEYVITPLGRTLREPLLELAYWAGKNRATIEGNRSRYDSATS